MSAPAAAREAWARLPRPLRWPVAYVGLVLFCAVVGPPTVGFGNAMFLTGASLVFASIFFIGLGNERGHRKVRDLSGVPIGREETDPQERRGQISRGVKLFLLGLALWAPLLALLAR